MRTLSVVHASGLLLCLAVGSAWGDAATYSVIFGGRNIGHMNANTEGDTTRIELDVKDNGRGPTIHEMLRVDANGFPIEWNITGSTTFGGKIDEHFTQKGHAARWLDAAGKGHATADTPTLYVAQSASSYADGLYARALLKSANQHLPVLPGGELRLTKGQTFTVQGKGGTLEVTQYDLTGINLTPDTILLDAQGELFATLDPSSVLVRTGYEGEEVRLRELAASWVTHRYESIEHAVAHHYQKPVRIRNVRIFDPAVAALGTPVSVLVMNDRIAAVEALDSPATPGEVTIEGAGGSLVAGMYEMHAHLDQDSALLNLLAGITTVRDMGNDNAVLDKLIERIDAGIIGGPHVVRSGFIEGKSPFNASNGILVDNEQAAVEAVRWYGARGYWQIKIYNSMNPAWVPAMTREAHALGMRVAGHVPAFSTADEMMAAGYDEMTHINQFSLGWVINKDEDTRTLFRLLALKRLPALDLNSDKVQHTINTMAERKIAIDPTLGIHEMLLLRRDGQIPAGMVDYYDHLPIGERREALKALIDVSKPGDDAAYRGAWDKLLAIARLLNERGILMVFGTDTGGSFSYHRELELYQQVGMSPAQILKRATYDSARYIGEDQRSGSIAKGKRADFFLVPGDPTKDLKAIKAIAMVVKGGTFYFPSEAYPKFGVKPFVAAPAVHEN
jgi:imidazolonepropionase-like amidohydrolase